MTNTGHNEAPTRENRDGAVRRPALSVILFSLAVIVAGAGFITWALVRPQPRTVEIIIPTPGPVTVHVAGEVMHPGVYTLPPGSRTSDAIEAAGGATTETGINLAALVHDGQLVTVIGIASAPVDGQTEESPGQAPAILVDLNTASASQLESLPNIGPARASSIISFRERNGPILFVDDLTAIDGIGPSTVEGLRSMVIQP